MQGREHPQPVAVDAAAQVFSLQGDLLALLRTAAAEKLPSALPEKVWLHVPVSSLIQKHCTSGTRKGLCTSSHALCAMLIGDTDTQLCRSVSRNRPLQAMASA